MSELNDLIQPGKTVKIFFNEGNVNNHVAHVRAIVDGKYVVYRVWLKHRRWDYRMDHISWFQALHENGHLEAA